jgi:hypothetical protein
VALIAGDIMAKECEDRTLHTVLSRPILPRPDRLGDDLVDLLTLLHPLNRDRQRGLEDSVLACLLRRSRSGKE